MKTHFIDNNTKVESGFHIVDLGESYQLKRRIKTWYGYRWKNVAWSYVSILDVYKKNINDVIDYLLWYERTKNEV